MKKLIFLSLIFFVGCSADEKGTYIISMDLHFDECSPDTNALEKHTDQCIKDLWTIDKTIFGPYILDRLRPKRKEANIGTSKDGRVSNLIEFESEPRGYWSARCKIVERRKVSMYFDSDGDITGTYEIEQKKYGYRNDCSPECYISYTFSGEKY